MPIICMLRMPIENLNVEFQIIYLNLVQYQKREIAWSIFSLSRIFVPFWSIKNTSLRKFLDELGFHHSSPTVIFDNNKSTINIVYDGNDKGRTKYIRIYVIIMYVFFVQNQQLFVSYRPTSTMRADILTKPWHSKLFLSHRSSLLGNLVCRGVLSWYLKQSNKK